MKKWIFITTCTVVVLLSTVNVYRVKITFNIKLQGYIEFAGKKYTLSPGVSVDRDVLIPICEKSEGNCCKKSWLDSSIRYL